jgi:tRNA threonylcarbamoyl adenosine modification protein YeaZ
MLTLLIETSTEKGAIFIFNGETLAFEGLLPPGLHNSSHLLPSVDAGLKRLGLSISAFDLIGVGIGPGSYTGLRVGAMAAKAMSYACKIPLIGLCTLDCFAPQEEKDYAVVIDAKLGGAYVQIQGKEPVVCPLSGLETCLAGVSLLITPNKKILEEKCAHLFPQNSWRWDECYPNAYAMYRKAVKLFNQNKFTTDGSLELMYMRKTQAELDKEQ